MAGVNKVILIGNLGKDPEIRNFDNDVKMASFSLATSESYKDREGNRVDSTEWHNIVLWRGLATIAERYLKKGSSVYIEGKIKTRSWEDENGIKKYRTEIYGEQLTMLGKKDDLQGGAPPPPPVSTGSQTSTVNTDDTGVEDDLPF